MWNAGSIFILVLILISVLRKVKLIVSPMQGFEKAINKVKAVYGLQIARKIEQIYRLETNNFKSKQFISTYSAGMEAHAEKFPYGWYIGGFWNEKGKQYKPIGTVSFYEGKGLLNDGGKLKTFLKFPNPESAVMTLAEFLRIYGNNAGRWFSTDLAKQTAYNNKISTIKTLYT